MKQYLLLEFAETPAQPDIDTSMVSYCSKQNLNVITQLGIPAVMLDESSTETMTKAGKEGSDSDKDFFQNINLVTSTQTRVSHESSDSDVNRYQHSLSLENTMTNTNASKEETDSDKQYMHLSLLTRTRTLTEAKETLDSDK